MVNEKTTLKIMKPHSVDEIHKNSRTFLLFAKINGQVKYHAGMPLLCVLCCTSFILQGPC